MIEESKVERLANDGIAIGQSWPLVAEFLDYMRNAGVALGQLQDFPGPVKHLLIWLNRNRIGLDAVDGDVVHRFLTHRCDCPRPAGARYQARHMRKPFVKGRILRFVQFLEESGRIKNPSSLDEGLRRVGDFIAYLAEQGRLPTTMKVYETSCRHFVTWLHQHRIPLAAIDDRVLRQFATHECICPGKFLHKAKRNHNYQFQIERFARFLIEHGVLSNVASKDAGGADHLRDFRDWLRRHRGIGECTIFEHAKAVTHLRQQLGNDPARYDTALINRVMLENLKSVSRVGAQKICCSLRMYLRFLASRGECSSALVGAIPRIPRWRLATLPRYILDDDVERVIASCDLTTSRGLRDRAILLLLARLALRRGDVAYLRLQDIDWDDALIRVTGKTRYTVALPLPQDVGDALAAYIEHARPVVDSDRVFIRSIAPYKPFMGAGPISLVVRDALKRARVNTPNLRGAYLLRHSAATNMLRSGATLDAVGALLRHRSPDTTTIYAKVDTTMLMQVAQPWIGRATCR
ncbi:tyrosine-type recombinase/integrase [Methylocystis sp. IM4]|uniref:tyrosine-type recombinase/integrase n=1 Tax=Methylocystis sp. IM4 TaxID=3136560 RepID=UPI00311A4FEA